eukprot:6194714-Pleurochrysis_carterae.AAC.1
MKVEVRMALRIIATKPLKPLKNNTSSYASRQNSRQKASSCKLSTQVKPEFWRHEARGHVPCRCPSVHNAATSNFAKNQLTAAVNGGESSRAAEQPSSRAAETMWQSAARQLDTTLQDEKAAASEFTRRLAVC